LLRNAQKRDKKIEQNNRDEPRWIFFGKKVFFSCFFTPLATKRPTPTPKNQKRDKSKLTINKQTKTNKKKASSYFFWGATENVRHFRHFFLPRPPLLPLPQDLLRRSSRKNRKTFPQWCRSSCCPNGFLSCS
jgi:hypothetical protein